MCVSPSSPHLGTFLQRIRLRTTGKGHDLDHPLISDLCPVRPSLFKDTCVLTIFIFIFSFGCTAHGIVIPQPGTEPVFLAVEA